VATILGREMAAVLYCPSHVLHLRHSKAARPNAGRPCRCVCARAL